MTNMKQKSLTQRTARRNRYITVVDRLRSLYNCSAAQVADYVETDLRNTSAELKKAQTTINSINDELEKTKKSLKESWASLREASEKIQIDAGKEIELKAEIASLKMRNERLQAQIEDLLKDK